MTTNVTIFDRLVAETQKLSPAPIGAISKGQLKRWADLAAFWETQPNVFKNVFYDAFFHIISGKYPYASKPRKPLISLVETALLTDSDAVRSWKTGNRSFDDGFQHITHTVWSGDRKNCRWHSRAMRDYVLEKLRYSMFFRDIPIPQLTLKIANDRRAWHRIANQLDVRSAFIHFEAFIELLVPDCRKWSHKQWCNEKFIFSQIQAIHGIDFTNHIKDFDALAFLHQHKAEGLPYYKDFFSIKSLPTSIVKALWPNGIEKELVKQFNIACTVRPHLRNGAFRNYDPIDPLNMASSWAFQQLAAWRSNKSIVSDKTRSKILQIGLGLHPWVEKHREDAA